MFYHARVMKAYFASGAVTPTVLEINKYVLERIREDYYRVIQQKEMQQKIVPQACQILGFSIYIPHSRGTGYFLANL